MRILTPCFPCFRLHPKLEGAFGVFTFRDFFPMLDLIFSHKSNGLPGAQQKMLLSLYPKLKASPHIDNIQTGLSLSLYPKLKASPHIDNIQTGLSLYPKLKASPAINNIQTGLSTSLSQAQGKSSHR